jgi:hypothetical protein
MEGFDYQLARHELGIPENYDVIYGYDRDRKEGTKGKTSTQTSGNGVP